MGAEEGDGIRERLRETLDEEEAALVGQAEMLEDMVRALRAGGTVAITVPDSMGRTEEILVSTLDDLAFHLHLDLDMDA